MSKQHLKHLFLLFLSAGIFYACLQNDVYDFEEVETIGFDVADARNWFEANAHLIRPSEVITRSADGSEKVVTQNPVFNWNLAEWSSNSEWEVVELPWEYKEWEDIFVLWEVWQYAQATNSIPENVTRLIVKQSRETRETFGFKMRMAPTLNFLLSNGESLHTNTYLHRDNRLSGIVLFYTLDGKFMNGWRYQDGEIVAELIAKSDVDIKDVRVPTTRGWWNNDPCFYEMLNEVVVTGPVFLPRTAVVMAGGNPTEHPDLPLGGGSGGAVNLPPAPPQTTPQEQICSMFRGVVNANSVRNLRAASNRMNAAQQQFIISLANVAALHELGGSLGTIQQDLVNFPQNSGLYTKLNRLNNHGRYTAGWQRMWCSYTGGNNALVSSEIGNSGFRLKFYPRKNGETNALGLVRVGDVFGLPIRHGVQAALEALEAFAVNHLGFSDDFLYDMHLFNALRFMNNYCR